MALPPLPNTGNGLTPASTKLTGVNVLNPVVNAIWGLNPNTKQIDMQDVASAKKRFDILVPDERARLQGIMDSTYGKGKWKYSDLTSGWNDAVDSSANYWASYGATVTVFDAFERLAQSRASYGLTMGNKTIADGAGGTSTQMQKTVRITDPTTARGLIDQTLNNYLGRNATSDEQAAFLKALSAQEKVNPTITKQTTTTSGKSSSSSSVTTGGFDPTTFAKEYAAGTEGAGEFQAATSLLDSFIGAIGAKV